MRELSSSFAAAPEVAARVPSRQLYTGARMPAIGFGTFGSDHASADAIPAAVRGAIEEGYRHIDCAAVYMNEDRIGQVLRDLFRAGLQREEMWITSKLWNYRTFYLERNGKSREASGSGGSNNLVGQ